MKNQKLKFPIASIFVIIELIAVLFSLINNFKDVGVGYIETRSIIITIITNFITIAILLAISILLLKRKLNRTLLTFIGLLILPDAISLLRYFSITNAVHLLSMFFIFYIACIAILPQFKVFKNLAKKIYFIPSLILLLILIYVTYKNYILFAYDYDYGVNSVLYSLISLIIGLIWPIGILFLLKWCVDPYAEIKTSNNINDVKNERNNIMTKYFINYENTTAVLDYNESYCELVKHILLSIFTFGIWMYIWIYKTTRALNKAPDTEKYNPTSKLLLCMFIPFYMIYWFYKHGEKIDKLNAVAGKKTDNTTMYLLFGIFLPLVGCILMQDNINKLCTYAVVEADSADTTVKASASSTQVKTSIGDELKSVEALKEYKSLLDMGIITQEEFDAKKNQLLGIREKAHTLNDLPEF